MFDHVPEVQRGQPITAEHYNSLVRAIRKRTPQAGADQTMSAGPGGFTVSPITSGRQKKNVRTPWQVVRVGTSGANGEWTVEPASVNPGNIMPEIGGTRLDAGTAPKLTISDTGTYYIYAQFTASLTFNSDGYLTSGSITDVDISSVVNTTGISSDDLANGTYYRHIATITDGVKTSQVMNYSLDIYLQNHGEFDDEAQMYGAASG